MLNLAHVKPYQSLLAANELSHLSCAEIRDQVAAALYGSNLIEYRVCDLFSDPCGPFEIESKHTPESLKKLRIGNGIFERMLCRKTAGNPDHWEIVPMFEHDVIAAQDLVDHANLIVAPRMFCGEREGWDVFTSNREFLFFAPSKERAITCGFLLLHKIALNPEKSR